MSSTYGVPYDAEKGRAAANKRWSANIEERVSKRIDDLVRMAPPLTQSQRAKLQALLSRQGA